MIKLEALNKIEDNQELYSYKFNKINFLMWPFIRLYLLQSSLNIESNVENPWVFNLTFAIKLRHFILSILKNPLKIKIQKDILIFGTDVSNIKVNDKYFNRLNEYFANIASNNTLIIERSNGFTFKRPRTFSPLYYNDWVLLKVRLKDKLLTRFWKRKNESLSEIHNFIAFLRKNYTFKIDDEQIWINIENNLIFFDRVAIDIYETYLKILKRVKPKLLLVEDACYGDSLAILVKAAKDLNIYVCEYQHGLVSMNHPAYNYSNQIREEYLGYLPDEFLSYGPYWEKCMTLPFKIRNIGNPHLSENIKRYNSLPKQFFIAFLSSGLSSEKNIEFVLGLLQMLDKNQKIIFRPHPCEAKTALEVYEQLTINGIQIDSDNLYSTIGKSEFIVSETSTVVYEAMAFNNIIFIIDSTYSRLNSGTIYLNYVKSPEEIICMIKEKTYKKVDNEFLWSKNWKENYLNLLKELHII